MNEICICAAVKFGNGLIIRGHRHADCFRTAEGMTPVPPSSPRPLQGFMTSENRFVDRLYGAALQIAAGIPSKSDRPFPGGELYSEDLY